MGVLPVFRIGPVLRRLHGQGGCLGGQADGILVPADRGLQSGDLDAQWRRADAGPPLAGGEQQDHGAGGDQ